VARPQGQFHAQTKRLMDIIVLDLQDRSVRGHDGHDTYFARKLGVTPRQVQSYLRHLRGSGSIEIKRSRHKLGPAWVNARSITPKEAQE
jgi:predicted transcriptional regulator